MSKWSADGARWRRIRREILAQSDVCWLCGHEGANEVDHLVRVADGGSRYDHANLRPAHGTRPCPVCGRKCNQERNRKPRVSNGPEPSRRW